MRLIFLNALLLAYLTFTGSSANACTILVVTNHNAVLVGNNEDWSDPDSKVWFLQAESRKHGRVYFGFKNGWSQGGMNDQGLFFDWVAAFHDEPASDVGKSHWPGNLCEKILEESGTVREAIEYYQKYYEPSFAKSRIMFADATGDSAIIGWENRQVRVWRKTGRYQVLSAEERTRVANERLEKLTDVTVEQVATVLAGVCQRGDYPTRYSNVYDLQRCLVAVYDILNEKKLAVLDLSSELAKGNHYYDLPKLPEQLKLPPLADGRALRSVNVDPGLLPKFGGTYEADTGFRVVIIAEQGKLFAQAEGPLKYELVPISNRIFFLPYTDAQSVFLSDENGQVNSMVFLQGAKRDLVMRKKP